MPGGGSHGSALSRRTTSSASPPVFGTASPMRGMPRDARTGIEGVSSRLVRRIVLRCE